MKKLSKSSYLTVAESRLAHLRRVAKTNKFAKGRLYHLLAEKRTNILGFEIVDYVIYESKGHLPAQTIKI